MEISWAAFWDLVGISETRTFSVAPERPTTSGCKSRNRVSAEGD